MLKLGQIAPLAIGLMSSGCFEDERVLDEDALRAHEAEMWEELGEVVDIWDERCKAAKRPTRAVCFGTPSDYDPFECEKLQGAIDATFREEMKLFEIFFANNGCSVDWSIERCDAMNGQLKFKTGVGGSTISSWSVIPPRVTCSKWAFME